MLLDYVVLKIEDYRRMYRMSEGKTSDEYGLCSIVLMDSTHQYTDIVATENNLHM